MNKRVVRFGLVGIFNTLSNLVIFNIFVFAFGLGVGVANIISVTFSMCLSFFLNIKFVFADSDTTKLKNTFTWFILSTIFSQLIIQQLVILLFVHWLPAPGNLAYAIFHHLSFLSLSKRFYIVNVAKCLAILVSLTVNYILYTKLVFKQSAEPAD